MYGIVLRQIPAAASYPKLRMQTTGEMLVLLIM